MPNEPHLPSAEDEIKERAAPGEPDLNGQIDWACMGDSRAERYTLGKFERFVEAELMKLSERIGENSFYSGFKNDVFWMQEDYPDPECTCGFDTREMQFWLEHTHTPNCASHQEIAEIKDETSHEDSDVHPTRYFGTPCDCYVQQRFEQWLLQNHHDPDCPKVRPRFRCGDIEFDWYKHIGRRMRVNRTITFKELQAMFEKCLSSLQSS